MNKTELMESYTMEELADMIVVMQNVSEIKKEEIYKMKLQIEKLEESNGRLRAELDTYNNCLLPRCTKEAKELIDRNNFSEVRIISVEQEKKCDCGKEDETNSSKEQLNRNGTAINQIGDILNELFGAKHDVVSEPDKFNETLQEKIEKGKTIADLLPTEPIKAADMLINASKKRTNCMTGEEYDKYIFEKWQLRQIAEHLLVFCNNKTNCEYQIPDADHLYPDKVSYIKEMEEYVRRLKSDLENK